VRSCHLVDAIEAHLQSLALSQIVAGYCLASWGVYRTMGVKLRGNFMQQLFTMRLLATAMVLMVSAVYAKEDLPTAKAESVGMSLY
jgi:CRISPR/Cas system-associated exonuclease Cas4 (RecB family)